MFCTSVVTQTALQSSLILKTERSFCMIQNAATQHMEFPILFYVFSRLFQKWRPWEPVGGRNALITM